MTKTQTSLGPSSEWPFLKSIFREKQNRRYLYIAAIVSILNLIIFKQFYPFPDFFSDSYSYIFAASANLDVSIWPIGYSKFIRVFHEITHSDVALVAFQYLLLEVASIYFFFTACYIFRPGRVFKTTLFVFLFFNPLFLYLSNYVNSDPIFASLSLIWFTELIWILFRPKFYQVLSHAVLLFLCFAVRNNAYYYPAISLLAFILSQHKSWEKLAGLGLPAILILIFIFHTKAVSKELTGKPQYSLFTGWQLANNALYMYGHIRVDSLNLPTEESRMLNRVALKYYSQVPPYYDDILANYVANFFIKQPEAPLKHYYFRNYHAKDDLSELVNWGKASIVFNDFGKYLILNNPGAYARYFVLINTKNYFFPPLEKLDIYNVGEDEVEPIAQDWFDFKTPQVTSASKTIQSSILSSFTYIFFFVNVLFVLTLFWRIIKGGFFNFFRRPNFIVIIASSFLVLNFIFSITTSMIVLRYQFIPLVILFSFSLLMFEWIDKKELKPIRSGTNRKDLPPNIVANA